MRAKPKFDVGDKVDIWSTKHESGWMPLGTIESHGLFQGLFGGVATGYGYSVFPTWCFTILNINCGNQIYNEPL